MCDKQHCMRPGRVTKNGYLNFLRAYRKKHCEFSSATDLVKAGAKAWNMLTCEQKRRYKYIKRRRSCRRRRPSCRPRIRSSCRPRRRSRCGPKRRQSSCRPRRRSMCKPKRRRPSCRPKRLRCRSRRRKKCMRAGPITNNGYLNFLRIYRRKCCGMSPQETMKQGAKVWCKLPCRQKMKYERMARKQACGSKRRRSCSAP